MPWWGTIVMQPITVVLGNKAPKATYRVEEAEAARQHGANEAEVKKLRKELESQPNALYTRQLADEIGETRTTFSLDPSVEIAHLLNEVTTLWKEHHSDEPPTFVACSDDAIEHLLAQQWDCPRGDPDDKTSKDSK